MAAAKKAKKAVTSKQGKTTVSKKRKLVSRKVSRRELDLYTENEAGIFIREPLKPVEGSKIRKGFNTAKREIAAMVKDLATIMTQEYGIGEIELTLSFSADGKFLGFGVGGAAAIKVKLVPKHTK